MKAFSVLILLVSVSCWAQAEVPTLDDNKTVTAIKKDKPYPGGRDEDDLKVQETLTPPTAVIDRHSIDVKVLKNYFKKADQSTETPNKTE
jgi:hypothetical protein